MENIIIKKYLRLFDLLDIESKLELLTKLTDNLKKSYKDSNEDKEALLDRLTGSWADVEDEIIEDIYKSRTSSDRNISFD